MKNIITITQYKWAGEWLFFKVKIPCGECSLTEGVIKDTIKDFPNATIKLKVLPWLDNWFSVLLRGGYHAPVIFVNNKLVAQGQTLDRGLLSYHIRTAIARQSTVPKKENIVFGKESCPFCQKAKKLLSEKKVAYTFRNVIEDPLSAHEMIAWVKPLIPATQPVTLPQIFLKGTYIGGYDELATHMNMPSGPQVCSA